MDPGRSQGRLDEQKLVTDTTLAAMLLLSWAPVPVLVVRLIMSRAGRKGRVRKGEWAYGFSRPKDQRDRNQLSGFQPQTGRLPLWPFALSGNSVTL